MRQKYQRKMRKQMGRRYLAILCIIAIFCTSLPITTIRTQARVSDGWEIFETNTGDPVAAAYGNGVFTLLNKAGIFYVSDDALTWTQVGMLPGTNGETNDAYKMLQMKYINNAFYGMDFYEFGKGLYIIRIITSGWYRKQAGGHLKNLV